MPKQHLTDRFLRTLKPEEKCIEFYDQHRIEDGALKAAGVKGLFVRLTKAGNKYFYYSYWYDGKSKRYKIGDYPNISLSEARDKARELAEQVNNGIDPQLTKNTHRSKAKPKTFDYLAEHYKKRHLPTLRPSTQRTYGNRIDSVLVPAFAGRYVKNISRGDIIELLEDIAIEQGSPVQSNRVRSVLSSMFTFAVQREIAEFNPVKATKPLGEESSRDRVLEEDEIRRLWQAFGQLWDPAGSLFQVLLLLGQRKGETRRMEWDHLTGDVWTIPKHLTKAKREHYVPLPALAVRIIESLRNNSPYVFESNKSKGQPVEYLHHAFSAATGWAEVDNIRIHDLRRTATTYMAELGTDRTILGKILNHKGLAGDTQVTARYDRHGYMDGKRTALNRWSHKLQQIIEGTETNVTKIG